MKITSGNNHLALLTKDGQVLTCGCGESGQLGRIAEVFATRDSRNGKGIGEFYIYCCKDYSLYTASHPHWMYYYDFYFLY